MSLTKEEASDLKSIVDALVHCEVELKIGELTRDSARRNFERFLFDQQKEKK